MARVFTSASSHNLTVSSAPLTSLPLAFSAWFRSTSTTSNQTIFSIADTASDTQYLRLAAMGGVAGDPLRSHSTSGASQTTVDSSSGYSANTWHHGGGWFESSANQRVFLDATETSGGTPQSPTSIDAMGIGVLHRATPTQYFDGRIADVAIWDMTNFGADAAARLAVFQAMCTAMVRGVPAGRFPVGLVGYWPLWGTHSVEIDLHPRSNNANDYGMTVSGATAANHAPVIPFSRRLWTSTVPEIGSAVVAGNSYIIGGGIGNLIGA